MAALIRFVGPLLLLAIVPDPALARDTQTTVRPTSAIERWRPLIAEASVRFGIPQAWIAGVMKTESGGQTHLDGRPIVSRAGAMGLMQLMPRTWAAMRQAHGLGSDPHEPRDNIMAGAAYLRAMYDRFGYPGLFAAYNAGPGRYAEHLRTGVPLPAETRNYVEQLAGVPAGPAVSSTIPSGAKLFFALGTSRKPAADEGGEPSGNDLFAARSQAPE